VKGTIELGEQSGAAALRELREESGIESAQVSRSLGIWDSGHDGQIVEFVSVRVPGLLPDGWTHRAPDDGGHEFEFFWHDLAESPSAEWHPLFVAALEFIRASTANEPRNPGHRGAY
jgi:8-oxo-dGTP pyrophosphatase MutT (NUDIX family)